MGFFPFKIYSDLFVPLTSDHPLGRNMWQVTDKTCGLDNNRTQLTLSTCSSDQYFTCNSGECVELPARCNGTTECSDESDELKCSMVIVDETYLRDEPPEIPDTFNPLFTTIKIVQFDKVDTLELTLTLTMDIEIQWVDPRVLFDNIGQYDENVLQTTELEGKYTYRVLPSSHLVFIKFLCMISMQYFGICFHF